MEPGSANRWIYYIFLLTAFFLMLILLDNIIGRYYEPHKYDLEESLKSITDSPSEEGGTKVISTNEVDTIAEADALEMAIGKAETQSFAEHPQPGSSKDYFEALKKKYQSGVLDSLPTHRPRKDIIIRYYHHKPDGNSAYALEKLRYYIHERPVDPAFASFQSNAIFYGDDVSIDDIQLVAYTLLSEGLPIKIIKLSLFHNTWKSSSIEIGTDTTLLNTPTLSLEDIKNLSL